VALGGLDLGEREIGLEAGLDEPGALGLVVDHAQGGGRLGAPAGRGVQAGGAHRDREADSEVPAVGEEAMASLMVVRARGASPRAFTAWAPTARARAWPSLAPWRPSSKAARESGADLAQLSSR
jgi:hypothetical protein